LSNGEVDWTTGQVARLHFTEAAAETIEATTQADAEPVCSICEEGASAIAPLERNSAWLLHQVQLASRGEQLVVLKWLRLKFKNA